jgi:hypothetical protein
MSTVGDPNEILHQMAFLADVHFKWNKESLMEYLANNENLSYELKYDKGDVVLLMVNDYDTVKRLAKNTNWCISKNKQYWNNGRFPHWSGFRWNFSYTFNNQTIKKWKDKAAGLKTKHNDDESPEEEDGITPVVRDGDGLVSGGKQKHDHETEVDDGYEKLEIPWSLTLSYSLAYANGRTFNYDKMQYDMEFTNSLTMNGNIGLGKGWKVSASMTYNFDYMKLTSCTFNISRDLHCWNMTASINPIGPYKSYTFHIGVNASILSDLKYDKNSNQSTNGRVTWW